MNAWKDLREIAAVLAFAMTAALLVVIFAPPAPPSHVTQTAAPVASAFCVCAPVPPASSSAPDVEDDTEFPQRPRLEILATKKKPQ